MIINLIMLIDRDKSVNEHSTISNTYIYLFKLLNLPYK